MNRQGNSRKRPTANSSQLLAEDVLHSTAIEPSKRIARQIEDQLLDPIVISAPSGFPHFSMVLQKHGFILAKPRNNLQTDQLSFRKSLSDWFSVKDKNLQSATEAKKFVDSMMLYLSMKENLIHSMTPTMHKDEVFQASLLHNLLSVQDLQPQVLQVLFPVLIDTAYSSSKQEDVELAVTILNQIKWIPNLVEEEMFVSSILDMVENATPVSQKEMIRFLPDIIPERNHARVGEMLRKLLDKGTLIVSSIMDCFSSLDITDEDWAVIRENALSQMFNAPLHDFPAYFGFLFRTEDPLILTEIITSMREKLEITPISKDVKNNTYMIEIVEKIEFCCSINPQLVQVWIKLVKDDLTSGEEIKPLDLMMLLIFAESFKSPLGPLKLLFTNYKLTVKLLDYMLKNNMSVLIKVFSSFSKLCDSILRTKDTKIRQVMEVILVKLFLSHGRMEAHEIASILLNLLLTGSTECKDSALRIFVEITQQDPKKLLMFAALLMSVVDNISSYPPHQIRQVMNILAILAHVEGSLDSERFCSEFSILLRKQLTHTNVQIRCLGVLGALATVRQLSQQSKPNEKVIKELLDLSWSFVEREVEACCIFFDELSDIVQFLPDKFCKQFQNILTENFERSWTQEYKGEDESKLIGQASLNLSVYFDANKEMETQKLAIVFEEVQHGMSPLAVPAHLRVIRCLVAKANGGDLTEIDAILGCPIRIPDLNVYYSDDGVPTTFSQKYHLGLYLLLAINFFRESISAFVDQDDAELRIKVWLRLSNVVTLQKIFARDFHSFHSIPPAYIAEKSMNQLVSKGSDLTKKLNSGAKKKKTKSKATIQEADEVHNETQLSNHDSNKHVSKRLNDSLQSKILRPYLRRLDSQVFILLKFPFFVGPELDFSEILLNISATAVGNLKEVERLTPDTLMLLLLELRDQTSDSQKRLNILDLKNIIFHLCTHVDSIVTILQKANGAMKEKLEACLQLLFKTISIYFETIARKESEEERQELFKKAITVLWKRCGDERKEMHFSEMLQKAGSYITKFSEHVANPSTALEHLHLLNSIHDLSESDKELAKCIENTSSLYLKTKWKLNSSQVEMILKSWLLKAVNPISVIRAIIDNIIRKTVSEEPCSTVFQSCKKENFHMWYTVLISSLAQHCSKYGRKIVEFEESLEFWTNAVEILRDLVAVIGKDRRQLILVPLLRYTRLFLQTFITNGIKLLPLLWNRDPEEAKMFTRSLQGTTRKIQSICQQCKVEGNVQVLKYVPLVKRALEALVFRVREVLTLEGAADAFSMGSLKHRNMDGEEINSQMYGNEETNGSEMQNSDDDSEGLALADNENNLNGDEDSDMDKTDDTDSF